jgi:DNA-binding NarL/FixJ family response regulator
MPAVLQKAFEPVSIAAELDLGHALARAERGEEFDLVVLDLGLPDCGGLQTLGRVLNAFPKSHVVVLSADQDPQMIWAALKAGAAGYLPKTTKPGVMIHALRLVAAGCVYIPPQVLEAVGVVGETAAQPLDSVRFALNERQAQVLRLLLQGYSNCRIASELELAESTVKYHVHSVLAALGASSRAEAITVALRRKLLPD